MNEKLAILNRIFQKAKADRFSIQTIIMNSEIIELINEILLVFGLPINEGYDSILIAFAKEESCTDELIDKTLIKLADEGAFYQTISGL